MYSIIGLIVVIITFLIIKDADEKSNIKNGRK